MKRQSAHIYERKLLQHKTLLIQIMTSYSHYKSPQWKENLLKRLENYLPYKVPIHT